MKHTMLFASLGFFFVACGPLGEFRSVHTGELCSPDNATFVVEGPLGYSDLPECFGEVEGECEVPVGCDATGCCDTGSSELGYGGTASEYGYGDTASEYGYGDTASEYGF